MLKDEITSWLGIVLAIVLVSIVIILAFNSESDWKKIAGLIPGFLAAAIILYFPSIKLMKFIGLEAQLQDRIRHNSSVAIYCYIHD